MADISKMAAILSLNASAFDTNCRLAIVSLESFVGNFSSAAGRIATLAVGIGTALAGGLSIGSAFKLAADFEDTEQQLTVLLKSADKAKEVLASLDDYATKTSFGLAELSAAAASLSSGQKNVNLLTAEVKMLGDIAKGTRIPLDELASIYGKMRSGKFIQGEELNQLVDRGLPIYAEFSKILGVTEQQVKKLASENKVTFDVLQMAFVNLTKAGGDYHNMAVRMGETTNGVFAQMTDAVEKSLRSIGQMLIKELSVKDGMKEITAWIEAFGNKVGEAVASAIRWFKENAETIKMVAKAVTVAVAAVLVYRTAIFAVVVAQKAWAISQAAVLALSGPKGWLILAGAAAAAGVAYYGVNKAFEGVEQTMRETSAEASKLTAANGDVERKALEAAAAADVQKGKADALANGISELTKKLEEQVATFGMSSNEVAIWKLQQQGATDAQLAHVRALNLQLEALEKNKKAQEELANGAKKYLEDLKTPWEKLDEQLRQVNAMEKAGLLTAAQAEKVSRKLTDELANKEEQERERRAASSFKIRNAFRERDDVVERRFTAGFETAKADPLLDEVRKDRKASEKSAKYLEQQLKNSKQQTVYNIPG